MTERRPALLWWTLPVPLVLAGSLGSNHHRPPGDLLVVGLVAGLAALCVPGAVYRPKPAVLVNGVTVASYLALGFENGPVYLTVPLTALVAGLRTRPRALLPWVAGALVSITAGLWARVVLTDAPGFTAFWQGVGMAALSLAACTFGWWWAERRAAEVARLRHTATEERLRMAQDLHDGVGHGLAVIAMQAGVALHVLEKDPDQARLSLEAIRDTSRESLEALRAELARISAEAPGPRRPGPGLADLPALVERVGTGSLAVRLRIDVGDPAAVPEPVGRVAYAVAQESLTNVLRHAQATSAAVTVRRSGPGLPPALEVTVEDDGRGRRSSSGTDAAAGGGSSGRAGLGLAGMRGRVERLGGRLEAGPGVGAAAGAGAGAGPVGYRVHAVIPWDDGAAG